MALAILEPEAFEGSRVRLKIDTGTNRYFRLRFGKSIDQKYGLDWVNDVFYSSPVRTNEHGGSLLNSSAEIEIPAAELRNEDPFTYAQLYSFKTMDGKGPTLSQVLKLPSNLGSAGLGRAPLRSLSMTMNTTAITFNPLRCPIPCEMSADRYAQAASLDELLSGILKVAGPLVANLLNGGQKDGNPNGQASGGQASSGTGAAGKAVGDILGFLLKTLLGGAGSTGVSMSRSQTWNGAATGNRFTQQRPEFAKPFIFGIDDAIFGAIIGQFVKVLPELANAAVQQRIQLKQADNKLTSDVLSEANRRMLLEKLIAARSQQQPDNQAVDPAALDQLIQLMQQAPPAAGAAKTPAPAAAKSLALDDAPPAQMSRAVISFSAQNPLPWNGKPHLLFTKGFGIQFKVRLVVSDPVPKSPLSKAIFKFVFKHHREDSIRVEKTFKQKNIVPNTDLSFAFSSAELAALPLNKKLSVLIEMRWPSSNGSSEHKALGSTDIVLVNKYFVKEKGKAVSAEKELTDMQQYRAFWNKVWESPVLDAANNSGDDKKYLWELDVNTKYSVLLSPDHPSNGLMETKILRNPTDDQDLSARTAGRMKAGIELSMQELNKLMALWDGQAPLDGDRLEALRTHPVAREAAGEFVYPLKLKGRARERGMVWIIPVFKQYEFTLNSVQKTDDTGQVVSVADETVRFPLPVAARVIGLKSEK